MKPVIETNRRIHERKELQVFVQFNFHGHEKVFESVTHNLSLAGLFVEADMEVLKLMDVGFSVIVMLEYQKDFFIRLTGYIVRIQASTKVSGFGLKFLDLSEDQKSVINTLLEEE